MSRNALTPTPEQLILLRRNLTDYFDDDELRALCSAIGVEYERLRGQGKAAKASELVRTLAARGRIPELVAFASRLRPDVSWGDVSIGRAARAAPPIETEQRPTWAWLGWLVAVLIVAAGLIWALSGGLRRNSLVRTPALALDTPTSVPATSTRAAPTLTPAMSPVTATPVRTSAPPTETVLPPTATGTPEPTPTGTPTPIVWFATSAPRVVTLLTPINGMCVKSPTVTFKWTSAALKPGESFLVAITPAEVYKAKCTNNYDRGVQFSPPLIGNEWTTDLSAPSDVPAACAGSVEWTIYIKSAGGNVAQVAPVQSFEWNPLRCK